MSQRTPGPFKTVRIGEKLYIEGTGDNPFLCDMQREEGYPSEQVKADNDAERIVTAMNSHDSLLAALKGVCRLYELGVDHETPSVGQALRNAADAINRAEQGG